MSATVVESLRLPAKISCEGQFRHPRTSLSLKMPIKTIQMLGSTSGSLSGRQAREPT